MMKAVVELLFSYWFHLCFICEKIVYIDEDSVNIPIGSVARFDKKNRAML